MTHGHSNPAMNAAMGNAAGMMLLAGGVMSLAQGLTGALDSIADARYQRSYDDALGAATAHANDMEDLARAAVLTVAELEAEILSLREACRQRQDVIVALTSCRG
jgi:hypothetical protein